MPPVRLLAAFLVPAAGGFVAAAPPQGMETRVRRGEVVPRVSCVESAGHSFALYLPSNYERDRAWPAIFCFDPQGNGARAVECFAAAAERYGYVLVGSNNSRNSLGDELVDVLNILFRDVPQRIPIDRRRTYLAGMSGGARLACSLGQSGNFAAVIACAAGFPEGVVPAQVKVPFFGCAGLDDFNFAELRAVDSALDARKSPHRVVYFDGGHGWPPAEVALEAVEWLQLQAMRSGVLPRDDVWLASVFERRRSAVTQVAELARKHAELASLAADFQGLRPTAELQNELLRLEGDRELRRSQKAERKAAERETAWRDRINEIIAANPARLADARRQLEREMRRRAHLNPANQGRAFPSTSPESVEEPDFTTPVDDEELPPGDRATALAEFAEELRSQPKTERAARRVLNGAYLSLFETGREAMQSEQYGAAAELFELAKIVRPEPASLHFELAVAYALAGERRKSRAALEAALERGFDQTERVEALRAALAGPERELVQLAPVLVRDRPMIWTSFGLALTVFEQRKTHRVARIIIREVEPGSEADLAGLRPGTQIVSADGRDVTTLAPQFSRGSDLARLFVQRHAGERINLEVRDPGDDKRRNVTLTEGGADASSLPWLRPGPP